jgi:hypothetical protein
MELNFRLQKFRTLMMQSLQTRSPLFLKILLSLWMMLGIFVFLVLFGPHKFWTLSEWLGIDKWLRPLQLWLQHLLTAGYLK